MSSNLQQKASRNIFLRMHPLHRVLLSLVITAIVYLFIRHYDLRPELTLAVLWDAFALSFIITSWIIFLKRPVPEIVKHANKTDGSKIFVLVIILVTSFASMFTVLLLLISKDQSSINGVLTVALSIAGMVFSWVMVHTIFTFHYAHMYYFKVKDDTPGITALDFPGEKKPDYLDFAYFAFVIGMTFQASDVEINSRNIRKTALAHGLLAFALNTFVVALTINIIAGLRNSKQENEKTEPNQHTEKSQHSPGTSASEHSLQNAIFYTSGI